MKKWFLLILFSIVVTEGIAQDAAIDEAWMREHYTKREFYIPMRDGVRLFTAVYMPKDRSTKHPVLMSRTPYSCAPYGEEHYAAIWKKYHAHYLAEGYIMVMQDVRGRWMSEGTFVNVRPFNPNKRNKHDIDEASDTYDTIDWLVNNVDNNNGNVGVFGISYPGFYSTMAALSGHPALKAVSPQAPVTNWFIGDDFHHNGAFFQMDAFAFYTSFGQPRPLPTTKGPKRFEYYTKDNYKFYLEAGSLEGLTKLMGDSIAFWKDLMSHGNYDTWWQERNVSAFVKNIQPATLVVGGLFDAEDCYGAWQTYKSIEKLSPNANNRIVMGPWYHGQWASKDGSTLGHLHFDSNTAKWYQENIEIPFFDYYLAGKGSEPDLAEATIFFTGENQWRRLPQWPMSSAQSKALYFHTGGILDFKEPVDRNSATEYVSDPSKPVPYVNEIHHTRTISYMTDDQRFASRRPDVITFQTGVLEQDVTIAGPVVADLIASVSSTDADFVVKLIDVFPDDFSYNEPEAPTAHSRLTSSTYPMGGYEALVRGEVLRGKFRDSFEKPSPFSPNKPTQVKFTLPDVAHTFKKGHRIMIQVQSSWFPLVDRNPQQFMDIYHAQPGDFKKATIKLYHDRKNASKIWLPILK
ncbi:X-Pro dipeptidyl-peptidase [Chitinophaga caeni]|uniref:X-Pro dipeptidyl-peptidase n=1 Tax=Chitinophaga caeni TaxID=2029983 RepID=A0A291QUS6_9BACT|nr:CocE/NonD family hydrolase [Chitinophaga caeni]ATL47671.1 X-Pro dipeptidyl-peptidase [Chitinophaga caeni]